MFVINVIEFINDLIKEYPEEANKLNPIINDLMQNLSEIDKNILDKGTHYYKNLNQEKADKSLNFVKKIEFYNIELNNIKNLFNKNNHSDNTLNNLNIFKNEISHVKKISYNNHEISLNDSFTHKKPYSFRLFDKNYYVKHWKEMLIKIYNILFERDSETFEKFALHTQKSGNKRIIAEYDNGYINPRKVANKYIIETTLDATSIRNLIKKALNFYRIDVSDFVIIAN